MFSSESQVFILMNFNTSVDNLPYLCYEITFYYEMRQLGPPWFVDQPGVHIVPVTNDVYLNAKVRRDNFIEKYQILLNHTTRARKIFLTEGS